MSAKTILNNHGFIHAVLKEFNPELKLSTRLPQNKKPDLHIPSDEEVKKLLDLVKDTDLEIPVLLAAFGPMRRGEICALKASDIDNGVAHVSRALVKNNSGEWVEKLPKTIAGDRYIWFPDEVIQKLPTVGKVTDLNPDQITQKFGAIIRENDLSHFRFHDLRHYCASIMHAMNIPDVYIIQRGGWETPEVMKKVYRHALASKASEADKKINSYFSGLLQQQ